MLERTLGFRWLRLLLGLLLASCAMPVEEGSVPEVAGTSQALEAGPPTAWWWYYGQTAQQVSDALSANQGRLVSLQVESSSPLRFTVAMVKNTGSYAKSWWWYYGQTAAQLSSVLQTNQARIVDLDAYVVGGTTYFAAILTPNTGSEAKSWWWYHGVTTAQISTFLQDNDARLVDLHQYSVGGQTRYAVVMIKNTGADASSWWWYVNVTSEQVSDFLSDNQAQLIRLEPANASGSRFNVIMTPSLGGYWWWYFGLDAAGVTERFSRNGARLADVKSYFVNGSRRFTTIMLNNENAAATRTGQLLRSQTDAQVGFYVQQVGGAVGADLQENFAYDPASSIKILTAVRLLRLIDVSGGSLSLSNTTSYIPLSAGSSCPPGSGAASTQSLGTLLLWMLENSDNAATRSLIDYTGGLAGQNSTAQTLGMTSTELVVYPGCNITNRTTLADMMKLYRGVADGSLLTTASRTALYARMPAAAGDFTGTLGAAKLIVDEEAAAAGLSASQISSYKQRLSLHYKAGGDTWCTPDCLDYLSITGIAELPRCNGARVSKSDYVWGVFTHGGSDGSANNAFFDGQAEPLREPIRAALNGWSSCVQ
ncbi:MAG TPA: serine hydrolase [Polyangiales bacterium]|nr:serine hydrolase [Polyangiales bacterium]